MCVLRCTMLRKALLLFTLALSSTACLDDDSPEHKQDGPQKSGEDDSDFEEPGDEEDDAPKCGVLPQDESEGDDGGCAPPK